MSKMSVYKWLWKTEWRTGGVEYEDSVSIRGVMQRYRLYLIV